MKTIVMAIHPEHVNNIINGTKKYEYRTKAAKKDINRLIIYETMPIKKVVAEAEILEVLALEPKKLWKETKEYSGITKGYFDDYFKNRKIAYAYKLGKIKIYDEPKALTEFGLKKAPHRSHMRNRSRDKSFRQREKGGLLGYWDLLCRNRKDRPQEQGHLIRKCHVD